MQFVAFYTWQVNLGALVNLGSYEPGSTCELGSICCLTSELVMVVKLCHFGSCEVMPFWNL